MTRPEPPPLSAIEERHESDEARGRADDAHADRGVLLDLLAHATHLDFEDGDCYERYDCVINGVQLGMMWEARHKERGVVVVRTRDEALAFLGKQLGTWTALMRG